MAGARAAPAPVSAYLRSYVATAELDHFPQPALDEFQAVFAEAVAAPNASSQDEGAATRTRLVWLRNHLETSAVQAFVRRRKWAAAEELARRYQPARGYSKAGAYELIIAGLVGAGEARQATALIEECVRADGSFPFRSAAAMLGAATVRSEGRFSIAEQGVRIAANEAQPVGDVEAKFLERVADMQPAMTQQVEDALLAMLDRLGARQSAAPRPGTAMAGMEAMAVLYKLDPSRANTEAARYPAFDLGAPKAAPRLAITGQAAMNLVDTPHLTRVAPVGRSAPWLRFPAGGARSAQGACKLPPFVPGGSATDALVNQSQTDPGGAVDAATGIADKAQKFAALAAVAEALSHTHPSQAMQAASSAYALLTKDVLAESAGWPLNLARTFQRLGDHADAEAVLTECLDFTDARLADMEEQYRQLEPEEMASQWGSIELAIIPAAMTYLQASRMDAALALARVQRIRSPILAPLLMANVAAGMAGAKTLATLAGRHP